MRELLQGDKLKNTKGETCVIEEVKEGGNYSVSVYSKRGVRQYRAPYYDLRFIRAKGFTLPEEEKKSI